MPLVNKRYSLQQIKNHQWFRKSFGKKETSDVAPFFSSPISGKKMGRSDKQVPLGILPASQPVPNHVMNQQTIASLQDLQIKMHPCFSQPSRPENMLVSTQASTASQFSASQNMYQRLVRRMTRFFTNTDVKDTVDQLCLAFERFSYSWKKSSPGLVRLFTKSKLNFVIFNLILFFLAHNQYYRQTKNAFGVQSYYY